MTNFNIKIISDNVCPFCYLGKTRLDKAIAEYRRSVPGAAADKFTFDWRAFYLDPNAPTTSRPVTEAVAAKFGPDRVSAMQAHMRQLGAAEGLDLNFRGRTGRTRDSHRIIQLAKAKGADVEDRTVHEVMRMYFEQGGDITSADDLVAAAQRAGIDPAESRAWLASDKGGPEVDKEVGEAYDMGVHGVPKFIINDKYQIGGAQDVEVFLEQLIKAKKAASA
jgi:predicted DsbA family dithiol-disulfide isomerase